MNTAPDCFAFTLQLDSPEATHELGRQLGESLAPGQIVALSGDLGAGKTTLTQGIAVGLGIHARVTSPTFTLINQYSPGERNLLLVHIDTYRLGDASTSAQAEAVELGLEEILADAALPDNHSDGAIVVIEWAERVADLLPPETLHIDLAVSADDPNGRTASLTTTSPEVAALVMLFAPPD